MAENKLQIITKSVWDQNPKYANYHTLGFYLMAPIECLPTCSEW